VALLSFRMPTSVTTSSSPWRCGIDCRRSVKAGGLVSYTYDLADTFRRVAEYVDRILRGEKPGDLPVQQPTKFNLVINLKTAKAIGITIPASLLARADELIE